MTTGTITRLEQQRELVRDIPILGFNRKTPSGEAPATVIVNIPYSFSHAEVGDIVSVAAGQGGRTSAGLAVIGPEENACYTRMTIEFPSAGPELDVAQPVDVRTAAGWRA